MYRLFIVCLVVLSLGLLPLSLSAQEQDDAVLDQVMDDVTGGAAEQVEEDPYADLPPSGTLSTTRVAGAEGEAVDGPFGGINPFEENSNPITGSVYKQGQDEWMVSVSNNTDDRFSVSLEVKQFNEQGGTVKRDSFSYTLKPGETRKRSLKSRANSTQAELNLKRWRNLSAK